jgi:hypothetical protein
VNDGIAVEIIHGGDELVLEFLLGCNADLAQDGAGEIGKEALDDIEPGAVLGCEGEFKPVRGLAGELFEEMRGMNDSRRSARSPCGRIGGDEFAAAMAVLD